MILGQIIREAVVAARSQPVASVVTILTVIGMILAVMLTTGRTVGAEEQVLGSIDSAGTRSITIRAEDGAGVNSAVLDRIRDITGIEWAGAFSSAIDATNSSVVEGTRVPVRYAYSDNFDHLDVPAQSPVPGGLAYASAASLDLLGLPDIAGSITLTTGASYAVAGQIITPEYLAKFEPLVLIPQPMATGTERVDLLVVVAERPDLVAPVSAAVMSVLGADDPTKVTVQTSEALAQLRSVIQGQLGGFSRNLVIVIIALTGALLAILLYGLVMMRRKDFGRRRALGATRSLIVTLLLAQTAALTTVGILLGMTTAIIILISTDDPLPSADFIVALAVLTLTATLIAALIPALIASRREPIRELRVP
ncbi:ABC transporter permease [Microbacterium sp. GXF6406]